MACPAPKSELRPGRTAVFQAASALGLRIDTMQGRSILRYEQAKPTSARHHAGARGRRGGRVALLRAGREDGSSAPLYRIHQHPAHCADLAFTGTLHGLSIRALLCATNTGSVAVKLWSAIRLPNTTNTQFAPPTGRGLAAVLKPGESTLVSVRYPMTPRPWQTELMYQRHDLMDRAFDRAWNTGNSTVQTWIRYLLPEYRWAQSGWVTNPPPLFAKSGFLPPNAAFFPPNPGWIKQMERQPVLRASDVIDASGPPGRYHLTAPPNWIDLSDMASGLQL